MGYKIKTSGVNPGIFASERFVEIKIDNEYYSLFVDASSIDGDNLLEVSLVRKEGQNALIELPRETVNAGRRITIPSNMLIPQAA